jgi:hypothetical protein
MVCYKWGVRSAIHSNREVHEALEEYVRAIYITRNNAVIAG